MPDRWQINVVGEGDRVRGQEAIDALLREFTDRLTLKGFTVQSARLSYTGITVVVELPVTDSEREVVR